MTSTLVPAPQTAAALDARRRATRAALGRVHHALRQIKREKAQPSVAAVARRAGVSRSFIYANPEARTAVSTALSEAGEHRVQLLDGQDSEREATWRERALNAEITALCLVAGALFPVLGYDSVLALVFGLPGVPVRPGTPVPGAWPMPGYC